MQMYPLKLTAPLKDYLWGGTRLKTDYGKETDLEKVAESWELSCHKDGASIIANGDLAGTTLTKYLEQNQTLVGTACKKFDNFPILIKLIDAKDNLSVQVHPNNEYALRVEGEYGKTEMWYIVDCDEGASLLYGFNRKITKEEFRKRIEDNTLLEVCNKVNVKKGEVYFIEAGTLHAIGSGILIAEIQQNSNTTYRIYDYGRVGADGKERELHVEKALEVTDLCEPKPLTKQTCEEHEGYSQTLLSTCEYFTVFLVHLAYDACFNVDETSFCSLLCLEGNAKICSAHGDIFIAKGETVFLPAGFGEYKLLGSADIILTKVAE